MSCERPKILSPLSLGAPRDFSSNHERRDLTDEEVGLLKSRCDNYRPRLCRCEVGNLMSHLTGTRIPNIGLLHMRGRQICSWSSPTRTVEEVQVNKSGIVVKWFKMQAL